jgi:hypothetical protein
MILGGMIDVVVWEAVILSVPGLCAPGNTASHLARFMLVPVLDIQSHNLASYQVSFPFGINTWIRNFLVFCKMRLMCLRIIFRDFRAQQE